MKYYPFKFLDAYNREDADFFFGRDNEIEALYEMASQNSIVFVYGASGTGKTSLIQCGLARRFSSYDWLPLIIRRGDNFNESLTRALSLQGGGKEIEEDEIVLSIEKSSTGNTKLIKGVCFTHFRPVYLIFDQFEEIFILGTVEEQKHFIETVKEILQCELPVKMIFSMREEYLGHLNDFEKVVPQLFRKRFRVEPMTAYQIRQVIIGVTNNPNSNVKLQADETDHIIDTIFDLIRGSNKMQRISLFELQLFLDMFYLDVTKDNSRRTDAVITLDALRKSGNISDILGNYLEEQVTKVSSDLSNAFPEISSEIIWKILFSFVTLHGTKEPIKMNDLGHRLPNLDSKLVITVIHAFLSKRILRLISDDNGNFYEIALDALAKRVAEKRTAEEFKLFEIKKLLIAQLSVKKNTRELLSEKQLDDIEPYLSRLVLTDEEMKFVQRSRADIKAKKKKVWQFWKTK